MHDFKYRRGALYCERVPLEAIARRFGTPSYIYSHAALTGRYRRLDGAFSGFPHLICYSVKSNGNIAILRTLAGAGAGFDIVSGGELRRAVRAGADPRKIIFAGVGKTEEEINLALDKKILFLTVESFAELEFIGRIARRRKTAARIAFRVNPDVDPHTHSYITTGKAENKFGISLDRVAGAYAAAMRMKNVSPVAVQMHIGSQITDTTPYLRAIKRVKPLVRELRAMGVPLRFFDIGGGLGINYRNEKPPMAEEFAAAVLPGLKEMGLQLILEPGRFIAGNSGILLTRVLYSKRAAARKFVIVDAGMNDLARPSLYGAYHEILPVRKKKGRAMVADIVGPVCESGDFLGKGRKIAAPLAGDLLAVMGAGAYGFVMSSNYNARRRPAEIMVKGARAHLIRERESYADLMRGERIPAFLK